MSFDIFSILRAVSILIAGAYVLAAAFMYVNQRSYQYFPEHEGLAASAVGLLGVQDLKLASGGETLQAWYAPAQPGRATILFLHGNGGEIAGRADLASPPIRRKALACSSCLTGAMAPAPEARAKRDW